MALDRESKTTSIPLVYLCHGGDHKISITAEKDSPWINYGVSLNGQPGTTLPLSAMPEIGKFQKFEESGAVWTINCPAKGADAPVETFQLWVQTEFTSPAYKIPVSLGHHRVVIQVVLSPIRLSVVGQEVKAIIQVESYYTQKALGDVKVKWRVGNTVVDEVVTTANGQSSFTFTPETVGEHTITAEVESLYYGPDVPVEQSFDFEVLENSPWEQATLSMNGTPVDLSKQDLVIFRGQQNDLTLEFAQLTGYGFTLQLVESDAGLNVEANPPFELEQPMPPTGQLWTLTPGKDKSGFCKLRISSPAVSVDWEIVCRVFSTDLGDEAEIEIGGMVVPVGGNTFIRGQGQTVTLKPKLGSPLTGHPVTLTCVIKSGLDVANVVSAPALGSEQKVHSWVVTGSTKSGTFQLIAAGQGMTTPITVALSTLLSTDLGDEAEIEIGGMVVPVGGNTFFRGQGQTVTLKPKLGSPLTGHPVTLTCVIKSGLDVANVVSAPALGSEQKVHSWVVTGSTKSGTFQLIAAGLGMTTPITVALSTLLSTDLGDEAEIEIGGMVVPVGGNTFFRGQGQTVTLKPKLGSPLTGHPVTLTCVIKSGLDVANVVSAPALGSEQKVHSWVVTGSTKSGTFQLIAAGLGMTTPITVALSKLLSTNLADEATVLLDGVTLPQNGADFIGGQTKVLTLSYKNADVLVGVTLALDWVPGSGLIRGDLSSQPPLRQLSTRHEWNIRGTASKAGTFTLKLFSEGEKGVLLTPNNRLIKQKFVFKVTNWPLPPEWLSKRYSETCHIYGTLEAIGNNSIRNVPLVLHVPGIDSAYTVSNSFGAFDFNLFSAKPVGLHEILLRENIDGSSTQQKLLLKVE